MEGLTSGEATQEVYCALKMMDKEVISKDELRKIYITLFPHYAASLSTSTV